MTYPAIDLAAWSDLTPDLSLVIADGPSVKITTRGASRKDGELGKGGVLVITDGPTRDRERMFYKVPRTMSRLVILGTRGYMTFEAKRWLADAGVSWVHVESGGKRVRILDQSQGFVNATMERKQVLCAPGLPLEETGVAITRDFIVKKLAGQAWNARNLLGNDQAADYIESMMNEVMSCQRDTPGDALNAIRSLEGNGAQVYWDAMKGTPVFYKGNQPLHPSWLSFPGRKTLMYSWETNKDATDPINAALNYGYSIGENLCVAGLLQYGLSPIIGISHRDKTQDKLRDSFALDLLEVIRPWIDEKILGLFQQPVRKDWFCMMQVTRNGRTRDGVVMVEAPFTHHIIREVTGLASRLQPSLKYASDQLESANI